MSSFRGQANQSLYLAKILLAAWQRDLQQEQLAALTLSQAYLPAMRLHLRQAYGWFLLELSRPDQAPAQPPASTADLPAVSAGKAVPPEVRECEQLERDGWLAQMLASGAQAPGLASRANLATPIQDPGPEEAALWIEQLEQYFDRMGDSLDEY